MNSNDSILVFAALFFAVALCIYIFKRNRVEKEPINLLLGLLFGRLNLLTDRLNKNRSSCQGCSLYSRGIGGLML